MAQGMVDLICCNKLIIQTIGSGDPLLQDLDDSLWLLYIMITYNMTIRNKCHWIELSGLNWFSQSGLTPGVVHIHSDVFR